MTEIKREIDKIARAVEQFAGAPITEQDVGYGLDDILHVVLHEYCHGVVAKKVPWINNLEPRVHAFVDEILARFVEMEVAPKVSLAVSGYESQLRELMTCGFQVTLQGWTDIRRAWYSLYREENNLEGAARYLMELYHRGDIDLRRCPAASCLA